MLTIEEAKKFFSCEKVIKFSRTPNAFGVVVRDRLAPKCIFNVPNGDNPEHLFLAKALKFFLRFVDADFDAVALGAIATPAAQLATLANIGDYDPAMGGKLLFGNYRHGKNTGNPVFDLTQPEDAKHLMLSLQPNAVFDSVVHRVGKPIGVTAYESFYGRRYFTLPIGGRLESPDCSLALWEAVSAGHRNFRVVCDLKRVAKMRGLGRTYYDELAKHLS